MAPRSPASLAELFRAGPLLTPSQRAELDAVLRTHGGDPRTLISELVRRGWLTPFQADHLLHGRGSELILGPYVLLDRLGEGGMGSIFKARHTLMERVVALKFIRTDRLSSPDTVERFHREIKALARLSHPHVVLAHDAAQAGATHFLVMEYVEGTDLARRIGERGPLPVATACDYIRQAALGLEHAHEHGLVHRDIKPANLLVTTKGVVKVLDLGLARLRPALQAENGDGSLTREGSVMGTPDYLAPEQADDASRADIRADIYSLGCTLYHLLAGQPPFPGGSLSQKLVRHQQARPADLRTLRPEVSPALAVIVQKMMAKRPQDRPSTPAEVAAALGPFCTSAPSSSSTVTLARSSEADVSTERIAGGRTRSRWRRRALLLGAAVALLLIVLAIVFLAPYFWSGERLPASVVVQLIGLPRADDPNLVLHLDGRPMALEDLRQPITLRVGDHELVVIRDGAVIARHAFAVAPADDQKKVALPEADAEVGELRRFLGHSQYVFSVAFSGDGTRLLSAGLASDQGGNSRGEVLLWDVDSPHSLRRLLPNRWVRAVALSADGRRALCGSFNSKVGSVIVWDLEAGKELRRFDGHRYTPLSIVFSPDETRALSADRPRGARSKGIARLWTVNDGKELQSFEGNLACFSPDGRRVLTAQDTGLVVWDAETGKEILRFKEAVGQVTSVAFSPDGLLALSTGDGMARLWDATTGTVLRTFKARTGQVYSAAFAPDGRRILTGGEDKMVRLWDTATGQELHCFEGHEREVRSVAFSPGGRRAASGRFDKTVRLWSLPK